MDSNKIKSKINNIEYTMRCVDVGFENMKDRKAGEETKYHKYLLRQRLNEVIDAAKELLNETE